MNELDRLREESARLERDVCRLDEEKAVQSAYVATLEEQARERAARLAELERTVGRLQAEAQLREGVLAQLREDAIIDNPEMDYTDGAHPAWWRGHNECVDVMSDLVNAILDGKDNGAGITREKWETTRRRLLSLAPVRLVA